MAVSKRPEAHRVRLTVDKAQLAGQVAVAQHGQGHFVSAAGMRHDLESAFEQHVETVIGRPLGDQELTVAQVARGHQGSKHRGMLLVKLGTQ